MAAATRPLATVVRSGIMRTTAKHRPAPSILTLPGVRQQPWFDSKDFAWTRALKAQVPAIRAEFEAAQALGLKNDYVVQDGEATLHSKDGGWDWLSYILKGARQASFAVHCPKTVEALEAVPGLMTGIPFAYAFFSVLKPGASIKPHFGPCNLRMRCHLPLDVPEHCGIRVAGETRQWVEGEPLLFDDSYEHEVWHKGTDRPRVVLLFDIWHPDLSAGEVEAITGMFEEARQKGWMTK